MPIAPDIRNFSHVPGKTRAQSPGLPLIGREGAENLLRTVLDSLLEGEGSCVIVEGVAGMGKSRILAEAELWAAKLGLSVAAGRASELDRIAPLTTLLTALSNCPQPILADADRRRFRQRAEDGYWLIDGLAALVEIASRNRPLVIVLDDAQWADELTALALRVLVPALRTSPVLWLIARRPLPIRSSAQYALDWLISEGAREVRLPPLSEQQMSDLCTALLGAAPDEPLLALLRGSGGNPFLLETFLSTLRDGGGLRIENGVVTAIHDDLPTDFLTAVDHRLRDLSPAVRRLLDVGSVLGPSFTLHEAAEMLGQPMVGLLDPADEAVQAAMLVGNENSFAFRHDLIREVIYSTLPSPVRQTLHRIAASALGGEGRPAPEIAEHLIRGTSPQRNEQTLSVVREAVDQVAQGAPGTAAELILGYLGPDGDLLPKHARLTADAVRLLASAGRLAEARELAEAALRHGLNDAPAEAAVLLGLAEALKHAGQDQAAIGYTRRALGLAGVPAAERARLLAIQAHARLLTNDIAGADTAGSQAVEIGTAVGEHSAIVFALEARSQVAYAYGNLASALDLADQATRIAAEAEGEARRWHPLLWRGMVLIAMDRMEEAAHALAADKRATDQLGTAWSRPLWHHIHSDLLLATGRMDDAEAEAEAGLRIAAQFEASGVKPALLGTLGQIALRRGNQAAADDYLRQGQQYAEDGIGVLHEELSWKRGLFQDVAGHPDQALETLAPLYAALPARLHLIVREPSAGPQLARIALNAGATDQAEAAAMAARAAAEANPGHASLAGAADHAEGLLGRRIETLRAAVSKWRASPRRYGLASALEDAGVAEHASGNRASAVCLLQEAMAEYGRLCAKRDVGRVRGRLRRLGIRSDSSAGRPKVGWASLTESELKVARLVAEGLTNRQIADRLVLSPHTVDTHIRHAFTKVGVSSRVALTRSMLSEDRPTSPTGGPLEIP